MESNWHFAIIVMTVLLVLVGTTGWYLAIVHASQLQTTRNILQADDARVAVLGHNKAALQQTVDGLQAQLATARQSADRTQATLAAARSAAADMAAIKTQLNKADARAAAAEAQLQAMQRKQVLRGSTRTPKLPEAAPTFDLPASASAHDYLAVSLQAAEAGNLSKTRAALGRAEVRSLNAAQLGRSPTAGERERSGEIQQAIDLLDSGKTASALDLIRTLLSGTDQVSTPQ